VLTISVRSNRNVRRAADIVATEVKQENRNETERNDLPETRKGTLFIDYGIVPGSFPNPVVSVSVCYTLVGRSRRRLDHDGGLLCWSFSLHILCGTSGPPMRTDSRGLGFGDSFPPELKFTTGRRSLGRRGE